MKTEMRTRRSFRMHDAVLAQSEAEETKVHRDFPVVRSR